MIFVSSWDDGHPLDRRLADLLAQRGMAATFYVPLHNREGRPVLDAADLRAVAAAGHEIGSHTADHRYLHDLDDAAALDQVRRGREGLEQALGRAVPGFCYPGGRHPASGPQLLRQAGVAYARSVENLRTDLRFDALDVPTTLQFYPHGSAVLLRNALRRPQRLARKAALIARRQTGGTGLAALPRLIESLAGSATVFHLWGHSWEVERLGAWDALASALDAARACATRVLTVQQLVAASAAGQD